MNKGTSLGSTDRLVLAAFGAVLFALSAWTLVKVSSNGERIASVEATVKAMRGDK